MSTERAIRTLSDDYARFKDRVLRQLDIMQTWQATTGTNGGGQTDHARFHDINSTLDHGFPLNWTNLSKVGSNLTEITTRRYPDLQDRAHNIVGADHTLPAPEYSVVGAIADNTLGVLLARGNAQAPGNYDTLLRADGLGGLSLVYLNLIDYVDVPRITSPLHLSLEPQNGGAVHTTARLTHPSWVSREFGIGMDFTEGWIDAQAIQTQRLHARYAIIDTTRAYAGDLAITKSVSQISEDFDFVVPPTGQSAVMVIDDLPGLDGIALADDGDNARVYTFFREQFPTAQPILETALAYEFVIDPSTYFEDDFEGYIPGADPTGYWFETGNGNSQTETMPPQFVTVLDIGGNQLLRKQQGSAAFNAHLHVKDRENIADLTDGYVITGRFRLNTDGAMGFTLFSKYSDLGVGVDEYVRLRRQIGGNTFEVACHGGYVYKGDPGYGNSEGTFNVNINNWYQFKIDGEVGATETFVRFKVWLDGDPEPTPWDIEVRWSDANRPIAGNAGLWLFDGDFDLDDYVISSRGAVFEKSFNSGGLKTNQDDWCMIVLAADRASVNDLALLELPFTKIGEGTLLTNQVIYAWGPAATTTVSGTVRFSVDSPTDQVAIVYFYRFKNVDLSISPFFANFSGPSPQGITEGGIDDDELGFLFIHLATRGFDIDGTNPPTDDTDMSGMTRIMYEVGSFASNYSYYAPTITADGTSQYSGTFFHQGMELNTILLSIRLRGRGEFGSLQIGRIWGILTEDNVTNTPDGTQAWIWTTTEPNYPGGDVIGEGQAMLIYGQGNNTNPELGDGYVEITTRDATGAPYMRMALMAEQPWQEPPFVFYQSGRLTNLGWTTGTWGTVITKPGSYSQVAGPTQYIEITDSKILSRGIPLQMYSVGGQWKVEIDSTGLFRLGTNLAAANEALTGFYFDPATGDLQIGRSGYPGNVTVVGSITILNPDDVNQGLIAGGLPDDIVAAGLADKLTVSDWGFLDQSPGNAGLYLTSAFMGFWNGSTWATYIDQAGRFSFGKDERIFWDGTKLFGRDSGGTTQWQINSSDGKIQAGAGQTIIDEGGVAVITSTGGFNPRNRYSFRWGSVEHGYLAGNRDNDGDYRVIIGAMGTGNAWGTISFRPYVGGDQAFTSGNVGLNSMDVMPGSTSQTGRGFQLVNYTNYTNGQDPYEYVVPTGRMRFTAMQANGSPIWIDIYVDSLGRLVYAKQGGQTGVIV